MTTILEVGESLNVIAGNGAQLSTAASADQVVITAVATTPPVGDNLFAYNADFSVYTPNGISSQSADFAAYEQDRRTFRFASSKAIEVVGTASAIEFDRDLDGWNVGDADTIWRDVYVETPASMATLSFWAIKHTYGATSEIRLFGRSAGGDWQELVVWNADAIPNATARDDWRRITLTAPVSGFDFLRWQWFARMANIRDGMKLTGLELVLT